ncbi:MAG: hypothetical protein ACRD0H_27120, partial [Actinomycetes bacterium]
DDKTTTTDHHVRDLHEFALNTHIRLGMRIGRAPTPARMWAYAAGTGAAWAAHRLLERLAEVDPDGVQAFAAELAEEGEFPEMTDPYGAAVGRGFPVQEWIDAEYARRDAKHDPVTLADGKQVCGDCSHQLEDGSYGYTVPIPCPDNQATHAKTAVTPGPSLGGSE